MKQKFRVGDLVYHPMTKKVVQIVAVMKAKAHPIKMDISATFQKTSVKKSIGNKGKETNLYQLSDGLVTSEDDLISGTPCPNCQHPGWDWVTGCDVCGLSPEDGR